MSLLRRRVAEDAKSSDVERQSSWGVGIFSKSRYEFVSIPEVPESNI